MSEIPLVITNATKRFGFFTAVDDLSMTVPQGSIVGFLGPNGAGKSTLFKAMLDLLEVDNGTVKIEGQSIDKVRKKVVYVPQKNNVDWQFPATVFDIVMMGRYPHKKVFQRLNQTDEEIATQALEEVGMTAFKNRQIGELSGGQQQRVFIARALCQESDIFFLDEPFVGVLSLIHI